MKKTYKYIILIIITCIFMKTTYAESCDGITFWAQSNFSTPTNVNLNGTGNEILRVTDQKIGGNLYTSYCINPGFSPGIPKNRYGNSIYPTEFTCMGKLLDGNGSAEKLAYEYGAIALINSGISMQNGVNKNNGNMGVTEENIATTMALRLYSMFWPGQYDNNDNNSDLYKRYKWYFNKYRTDETINSKASKLNNSYNIRMNDLTNVNSNINWSGIDRNSLENEVKRLIIAGLNGAINYTENGIASITWNSAPIVNNSNTEYDSANNAIHKSSVTYTFKAKNFNNSPSLKINFNCENCSSYNVDYELFVQGSNDSSFQSVGKQLPSDMLQYLTNGSGDFKVKIEFKGVKNQYNCQALKYNFHLEYQDGTISTKAYKIKSSSGNTAKRQSFFVVYSTSGTQIKDFSNSIRLCNPTCKELESSCNGGRGPAEDCTKFKNDYNNTCVACTTKLTSPSCTQESTTMYIKEGYEEKSNKCQTPTENNVKSCIINGEDKNGNSYQATDLVSDGNKYCSVWCKEDYKITLPGTQNVMSGTYFSLQANVKGTKTCYTSNIDIDTFKSDINIAQNELQAAFNAYNSARNNTNLNNLKETNDRLEKIISSFQSCSNWTMSYNFQPKIKFNYEEKYMNSQVNKILEPEGQITKSGVKTSRCEVETSDKGYTECQTGWKNTEINETISIYRCSQSGGTYNCGYRNTVISKVKNMQESIEAFGSYATPTQFMTLHASGSVILKKNVDIENGSMLKNGLPVPLNKERGIYNYTLKIENLGEYYNNYKWGISQGSLGRIWGANDNLISEILKEQASCGNTEECLKEQYSIGSGAGREEINNGVYVCKYVVNIDQCTKTADNICNPNCPNDPDCNNTYECAKNNGEYYCQNGQSCTKEEYNTSCCKATSDGKCDLNCDSDPDCNQKYVCEKVNEEYYCDTGEKCTKNEYNTSCCKSTTDGKCDLNCNHDPDCDKCKEAPDNICDPNCSGDPDCNNTYECTKNNGEYYCQNGQSCTKEEYNRSCCKVTSDGKCDLNCDNDPDCNKCIETPDNVCDPECPQDPDCDKCRDIKDGVCSNCPEDPDCPKPGVCSKSNNKFYCETGEECTEEQYNIRCCPECGQSLKYKCMEVVENGKIVYYGKNYQKLPNETAFKSECCEDGKCQSTCKYCLYDSGKLNLTYRSISSDDINPNNREPAVNWTYSTTYTNPMISLKAKKTVEEIKANGENIYNVNFEDTSKNTDFAMKIEMDSKMIAAIRAYSQTLGNVSSEEYSDTLNCYDYKKDGNTYENIFCYSKLIDTLMENDELNSKIQFSVPRPTKSQRNNSVYVERYWTVWTEYNIVGNSIGGPSWK